MNNEKMNQIIDEAYKEYAGSHWTPPENSSSKLLGPQLWSLKPMEHSKETFINKCKSDPKFSKKWGLRIEERELSLEERYKIWFKNNFETGMEYNENNLPDFENDYYETTPTRLITITYNNETIEVYE
jgi:hypothetical protein